MPMIQADMARRFKRYQLRIFAFVLLSQIVAIVLTLSGVITMVENIVFASSVIFSMKGLAPKIYLIGYGVAKDINNIANRSVVNEFGGVMWGGYVVRVLVEKWRYIIVACMMLGIWAGGAYFFVALDDVFFNRSMPYILVANIAGFMVELLAEVCNWLMVERRLFWYMHEHILRRYLEPHKLSQNEEDKIVQQARDAGLLWE